MDEEMEEMDEIEKEMDERDEMDEEMDEEMEEKPDELFVCEEISGEGTPEEEKELRRYMERVEEYPEDAWVEMYECIVYTATQTVKELPEIFQKHGIDPEKLHKEIREYSLDGDWLHEKTSNSFEQSYVDEENAYRLLDHVLYEVFEENIDEWPEDEQEQIKEKMREVLDEPRQPIHDWEFTEVAELYYNNGDRRFFEAVERQYAYKNLAITRKIKKYWDK